MRSRKRRFQASLEHVALVTIVIGALLWMKGWVQKSIQGRMKANADSTGYQFDPDKTDGMHVTTTTSKMVEEESRIVTDTQTREIDNVYTPASKK